MDNLLQCLVTPMSRKFFSTFIINFPCCQANPSFFLSLLHTKKKLCFSFLQVFLYSLSVLPSKSKHTQSFQSFNSDHHFVWEMVSMAFFIVFLWISFKWPVREALGFLWWTPIVCSWPNRISTELSRSAHQIQVFPTKVLIFIEVGV